VAAADNTNRLNQKGEIRMPMLFTPTTRVKYVPFDFEGYLSSLGSYFGHYSFFEEWKDYWLAIFLDFDAQIKDYIQKSPHLNPVTQRVSEYPILGLEPYEVFQYAFKTDFGTFTFHFDVPAMNHLKGELGVPIEIIQGSNLRIDPETPLLEGKLADERLPFFIRFFGIKESFICADGNKRTKARIERGDTEFRGYVFYPEHMGRIFFGPQDLYFYRFLYESSLMYAEMKETGNEQDVFSVTQMYLQAHASK
jgi:hypothetical protein